MASKSSSAEAGWFPLLRFFCFFSFELRSLFMTSKKHSSSRFSCRRTLYSLSLVN